PAPSSFVVVRRPPSSTLLPYTTLFRSGLAFTATVSLVFGLIVVWLLRHDLFSTSRSRSAREVVPTGAEAADPVGQEPAEARPPRRMIALRGGLCRIYLTGFLCMIVFGGSF